MPTNWKEQMEIFQLYGCRYKHKKGSHHILTYPNAKRAVVIPEYDEINIDIIKNNYANCWWVKAYKAVNLKKRKETHEIMGVPLDSQNKQKHQRPQWLTANAQNIFDRTER